MPAKTPLLSERCGDLSAASSDGWAIAQEGGKAGAVSKCGCNTTVFLAICMLFTLVGVALAVRNNIVDDQRP